MGLVEQPTFNLQTDGAPSEPPVSEPNPISPETHLDEIAKKMVIREKEVSEFKALLDHAASSEGLETEARHEGIVVIRGISGMGKSTLLKQFEAVCQDRNIPFANLKFSNDISDADNGSLLLGVIRSLATDLEEQKVDLHRCHQSSAVQCFTDDLAAADQPIVIALDDLDKLDWILFKRFQSDVMKPLVTGNGNKVVFVSTSTRKLGWDDPDLVSNVFEYKLPEFDRKMTAMRLEQFRRGWQEFSWEIQDISGGLPLAVNNICHILDATAQIYGSNLYNYFAADFKTAISTLTVEQLVDLRFTQTGIHKRELPKVANAFRIAAIAGMYDEKLMGLLLTKFAPESMTSYVTSDLMGKFIRTGLVDQDNDGITYTVEPVITRMCDTQLKLDSPLKYYKIHNEILEYYRSLLSTDLDNDQREAVKRQINMHKTALNQQFS